MRTIKRVKITAPIDQYVGIMAESQEEAEDIVKEIISCGKCSEANITRKDLVEQLRKKGCIFSNSIKVNSTEPGILKFKDDDDYNKANAGWKRTDGERDYGDGVRYEEIHAIRKPKEKRYDIQIFMDETDVVRKSVTLPNGIKLYGSGDTTTYIELRDVDEAFFRMLKPVVERMGQVVSTVFKPEKLKDGPVEGRHWVAWKVIKKQDDAPAVEGARPIALVNPFDSGSSGIGITFPFFSFSGVLEEAK